MLKVTLEEARKAIGLPVVDEDGTTIDFPAVALIEHEGEEFVSVEDALCSTFSWCDSPEGAPFWTELWELAFAWMREPADPAKARNAAWMVRQARRELDDAGLEGVDGFSAIESAMDCLEDDLENLATCAALDIRTSDAAGASDTETCTDLPICRVCDGDPGNDGVCLCGAHAYGKGSAG
jgi:hypothetical protein